MSLLARSGNANASVQARTHCETFLFSKTAFHDFVLAHPQMEKLLCRRIESIKLARQISSAMMQLDADDLQRLLLEAERHDLGDHPTVQAARDTFKSLAEKLLAEVWASVKHRSEGGAWRMRCVRELAVAAKCNIDAVLAKAEEQYLEQSAQEFARHVGHLPNAEEDERSHSPNSARKQRRNSNTSISARGSQMFDNLNSLEFKRVRRLSDEIKERALSRDRRRSSGTGEQMGLERRGSDASVASVGGTRKERRMSDGSTRFQSVKVGFAQGAHPERALTRQTSDKTINPLEHVIGKGESLPWNLLRRSAESRVWMHKSGIECDFWFLKAECIRDAKVPTLTLHQDLRENHPEWLEEVPIRFEEAQRRVFWQGHTAADTRCVS